jgi:hypothetical protein
MGKRVGMIGDRLDIETHRARDVAGAILRRGVAILGGEIVGTVEHHEVGRSQACGKPIRGDQPAATHRAPSWSTFMGHLIQRAPSGSNAAAAMAAPASPFGAGNRH